MGIPPFFLTPELLEKICEGFFRFLRFFQGTVQNGLFHRFQIQEAGQVAVNGNRNNTGLLGDDNSNGVGVFRNADAGSVSGPQLLADDIAPGKRQNAPCGADPALPDDDGAVMQRGAFVEYISQKLI